MKKAYEIKEERVSVEYVVMEVETGSYVNTEGYHLIVLDFGRDELWCEWENGARGTIQAGNFFKAGYRRERT